VTETKTTLPKVEVEVGNWLPDGTFTGHLVRFTGAEVGSYTDVEGQDYGTTYTLYACHLPDHVAVYDEDGMREEGYRVLITNWRHTQDQRSPCHAVLEPDDPDRQTPFNEDQARNGFPELFADIGEPNIIDLD
jgi:hypothetical protein